jgi:hypothetical protein
MTRMIFVAAALALTVTLPAVSALAQAPRTFVSAAGTDNSTCSFAAPCRHFQNAVNVTSPGGEVDALDPAGYGPITIGHAITIEGQGWSYIAPPTNGAAIVINALSGDKIVIHGVSLNGVGIVGGTGIAFDVGGSLSVQNCVIQNFANDGIFFGPNASGQLFVSNTVVSNNDNNGIVISPGGSGTTTGVLDHVKIESNINFGLDVFTNTFQTINITISDSVSANNGNDGIVAASGVGTPVSIMVRNTTVANNVSNGLIAQGVGATIRVTRSTVTGNGTGWAAPSNGVVASYDDNNIDGNTNTDTTPPPIGYR